MVEIFLRDYEYDEVGNRTRFTDFGGEINYQYNDANELLSTDITLTDVYTGGIGDAT